MLFVIDELTVYSLSSTYIPIPEEKWDTHVYRVPDGYHTMTGVLQKTILNITLRVKS